MRSSRGVLVCLVVALAWAGAAWGDDYTGATGGNYNVGTNWSGGSVPDSDDLAYIRNGATVTLDASVPTPNSLWVGGPSDPSGGSASALHILPGAVLVTATGSFVVAQQYDAVIAQTGGSVATGYFRMSENGGGDSTYNLSGGSLVMDYNTRLDPSTTWTMDIGRSGGTAKVVQTGGYLMLINNHYLNLGYGATADGVGEITMTNGSVNVGGAQSFNVGRSEAGFIGQGKFTMSGGIVELPRKFQIGYRGTGEFNQSGGVVLVDRNDSQSQPILLGEADTTGGASGVYNLSGGSLALGGIRGLRVGSKFDATYGTGVGLFNVSGGSATMTGGGLHVGTKGARGTVLVSNGVVEAGNIILADNVTGSANAVPQGYMRVSGGSVGATGLVVGMNGLGRLEVTGGSLVTPGTITVGSGDTFGTGTGELKVGSNAVVKSDSSISFGSSNGKLEMEIASATKNSKITSGIGIYLNSGVASLTVDSTGYRPKEGDKFTLLTGASGVSGSFSSIGSNITLGLPGASAFSGAIVSDPTPPTQYYVVTFLGYTAGDANGDSIVDGGDLALMGGNWMQSGITWAGADFTGDGLVDGGDLALIGGNWMWQLPPAPEAPLPEPATLALLSVGVLAVIRRKR